LHPYRAGKSVVVDENTSKPWISWGYSVGSGSKIVTEVSACSDGGHGYPRPDNKPECEANARLIAAAPELLYALQQADECLKDMNYGINGNIRTLVCNAIAKATGKQGEQ
jgi:hypothetical protein